MSQEWFDIYDEQWQSIGQAPREEVHRLGHWHITFHCWLYELRDGIPFILFQRRQLGKDTNPLCYDITVAGHLSAGEQLRDAVREIEEEIGLVVSFEQLVHIMDVKEEATGAINGQPYWDRELSHVFALSNPVSIQEWRLQPEEVMAIYAAPLVQLRALLSDELEQLEVYGYELLITDNSHSNGDYSACGSNSLTSSNETVRAEQFVPRERSYYLEVLNAIEGIATNKS